MGVYSSPPCKFRDLIMKLDDAGASDGMDLDDHSSTQSSHALLYLCFEKLLGKNHKVQYDFYTIRLEDLICDQCSSGRSRSCQRNCSSFSVSELGAPWKSIDGICHAGCGVYRSRIVIAGGRNAIYTAGWGSKTPIAVRKVTTVDTEGDKRPPPLPVGFQLFRHGKFEPVMAELGGKLYALPGPAAFEMYPVDFRNGFEVFDTETERWSHLPLPPFASEMFLARQPLPWALRVAFTPTRILVYLGGDQLYSFNTVTGKWAERPIRNELELETAGSDGRDDDNELEIRCCDDGNNDDEIEFEWKTPGSDRGAPGNDSSAIIHPFRSSSKILVVDDLLFCYDLDRPWALSVFRISEGDSEFRFRPLRPLELPGHLFPSYFYPDEHELVHLGGPRLCLVLKKRWSRVAPQDERKEWMVGTIIFEFYKSSGSADDASTTIPSTITTGATDDDGYSLDCVVLAPRLFRCKLIDNYYPMALRGAFVL